MPSKEHKVNPVRLCLRTVWSHRPRFSVPFDYSFSSTCSGFYFRKVSGGSSLSWFSSRHSPFSAVQESCKRSVLTRNHEQHDPLHIVSSIGFIEWHLICLVFDSGLLLVTDLCNNTLAVSRAVFHRVAEVLTVQADVLLLQRMPEKGLGGPQNRVQTCPAKGSVSLNISLEGVLKYGFFFFFW